MLLLLFIAFMLALIVGFDVGFSMILSAWLGVAAAIMTARARVAPAGLVCGLAWK